VKIVVQGEWPSGWIGWLVTSVGIAGLLGFLLIHPLRDDPAEPWIRTYSRALFLGLIPAAVMLLVAFWKRIIPYGLTEPRLLGIMLGLWLLVMAVWYTVRPRAGIRLIPVTLAILLLATVYGPLSVTALSVASQGSRLKALITEARDGRPNDTEASAALRFLLDHGAQRQIVAAIPGKLPAVNWDRVYDRRSERDSTARLIMVAAGMRYRSEHAFSMSGSVYFSARRDDALPIEGYQWSIPVSSHDSRVIVAGMDSVRTDFDNRGLARIIVGRESVTFDLRSLARRIAGDSTIPSYEVPADRLRLHSREGSLRAMLALGSISGEWVGDSVRVQSWQGTLFLGR
jgi:hypothetical protein